MSRQDIDIAAAISEGIRAGVEQVEGRSEAPCDHSPPPDSAFAWSDWARCTCGEHEFRRASGRVELMTGAHYEGLRAEDGTPIDSRGKWTAYMKANGLAPAEDYRGQWQEAARRKAEAAKGNTGQHKQLTETVGRLAYQLRTQRSRNR